MPACVPAASGLVASDDAEDTEEEDKEEEEEEEEENGEIAGISVEASSVRGRAPRTSGTRGARACGKLLLRPLAAGKSKIVLLAGLYLGQQHRFFFLFFLFFFFFFCFFVFGLFVVVLGPR